MPETLLPFNVIQQAAEGHVKEIAAELNVSLTTVYKMLSDDGYDPHGRALMFHKAVFKSNPAGADLLFEDYQAFHESLKSEESVKVVTREQAAADALHAVAEFVKGEERDFETKATNAIRAIRFLMISKKTKI
jgi:hypothetical protein